jgi:hypothetical protein
MRSDAHSSRLPLLAAAFSLGLAQSVSTAKHLALAATVLTFLLAPVAANAVPIVATFEGTITSVSAPLSFVVPGDTFSGSFRYESDRPAG